MLGDATGAELLYLPADVAKDGAVVQRAYDHATRLRRLPISEFYDARLGTAALDYNLLLSMLGEEFGEQLRDSPDVTLGQLGLAVHCVRFSIHLT